MLEPLILYSLPMFLKKQLCTMFNVSKLFKTMSVYCFKNSL